MGTRDRLPGRVAPTAVSSAIGRRYEAPPIQEALAEVYFRGSQWDPTIPGVFYGRIKDQFPTVEHQSAVQIGIEMGPRGTSATPSIVPDRARFRSADQSRIVQVARDLVVVNRLRPYERFQEWQGTFVEMLGIYRELAKPTGFARVGVRYLNKIVIPEDQFELSKYFRIYPEVPEGMGSPFENFLLRVQSHPPMHASHMLVTTFGSDQTDEGAPAILLDLYDVIEAGDNGDLAVVERLVSEAHDNISGAFENALTEEARALFHEGKP